MHSHFEKVRLHFASWWIPTRTRTAISILNFILYPYQVVVSHLMKTIIWRNVVLIGRILSYLSLTKSTWKHIGMWYILLSPVLIIPRNGWHHIPLQRIEQRVEWECNDLHKIQKHSNIRWPNIMMMTLQNQESERKKPRNWKFLTIFIVKSWRRIYFGHRMLNNWRIRSFWWNG